MWCTADGAAHNERRYSEAGEVVCHRTHCESNVFGAWRRRRCVHDGGGRMVDGGGAEYGEQAVAGWSGHGPVALAGSDAGAAEAMRGGVGRGGATPGSVG